MKKIYAYSAVLATAISLIGCGGGGDNSSAAPANTKATISIGNASSLTYARAALLDQNGNLLAEQEINCQTEQINCEFYLKEVLSDSEVTLLVQDNQGRMIRAFKALGSELLHGTVYPSSVTTGYYLTEKLKNNYFIQAGVPQDETYLRLAQFFQNYSSPDGIPEYDEEVGDYYAKQKASNPSFTEAEFLAALMKRLASWDIATVDELPASVYQQQAAKPVLQRLAGLFNELISGKVEPISVAYAQTATAGCSTELENFLKVTGSAADAIPIVGGVVSGLFDIAQNSCSTADAKLDQISSQLTELNTSVSTVGTTLAQAKALGESNFINKETQKFKDARQTVINKIQAKTDFLEANRLDGTTTGPKAASLEAWFDAMGGYTKGMNSLKTEDAKTTLKNILKSMNVVIADMTTLTTDESLKTYFEALNGRCKDIKTNSFSGGSNFVATRQSCNNAILANVAYLMGTEGMVLPLAKDIFKVLDKYYKSEGAVVYNEIKYPQTTQSLIDKYPKENLKIVKYEGAYEKTKTIFRVQQSEFLSDIRAGVGHSKTGYFNTFEGLPVAMVSSAGKSCYNFDKEGKGDGVAIDGWYSPTATDADRYITTRCHRYVTDPTVVTRPIKAKYYYAIKPNQDNNLINVLGVLVEKSYVDDKGKTYGNDFEDDAAWQVGYVFNAPKLVARGNDFANGKIRATPDRNPGFRAYPGKSGYYQVNIGGGYMSTFETWVAFTDSEGYDKVALLAVNPPRGDKGQTTAGLEVSCKTPDCRAETNNHWLIFKSDKGDVLNVDLSYMSNHAYIDNMYVYQLGPLK